MVFTTVLQEKINRETLYISFPGPCVCLKEKTCERSNKCPSELRCCCSFGNYTRVTVWEGKQSGVFQGCTEGRLGRFQEPDLGWAAHPAHGGPPALHIFSPPLAWFLEGTWLIQGFSLGISYGFKATHDRAVAWPLISGICFNWHFLAEPL